MDAIAPRFPPQSLLLTFCLPQTPRAWSRGPFGHAMHRRALSGPGPGRPASVRRDSELAKVSELAGARALVVDPAGETCQKSGGFHQLEKGLRSGRGDARNSDFADLALCSSAACRFSSEGRTTPFRCLLLMKTTRFLACLPDICVHPEIGGA